MSNPETTEQDAAREEFVAAGGRRRSLPGEIWAYLRENRKWWLTPIFLVLFLFGLLVVLTQTGAAPFIYTLF